MELSREDLEQWAIRAVDAYFYYDLMDYLEEAEDEDLLLVINAYEITDASK